MKKVFLATASSLMLLAGCNDNVSNTVVPSTSSVAGRVTSETDAGLSGRTVFVDLNGNGRRDSGEPVTTTGADGTYSITSIPGGTFRVAVELQAGETLVSTSRSERIVGGTNAAAGAYPWMVQVQVGGGRCGGTLVRSNWVLTAAHCFFEAGSSTVPSATASQVTVRFGSIAINEGTPVSVRRIVNHPNYRVGPNGELINDVTLLELSTPVTNVQTIPFATSEAQFAGVTTVRAIGWGATSEGGDTASTLQQVDLPLLSNTQCQTQLSGVYTISDVMICAGGAAGRDACQGDSGGPLFVNAPNGPLQVGITSFGEGCARPNRPGVYARTSAPLLTTFINNTIGAAPTPTPTAAPTATPTASPTSVATSEPIQFVPGQPQTVNFRIRRP